MNNSNELDIGPLTWVKGEIDLALERSATALKNYAATWQSETPDLSQLKAAQAHLHQAHGALSIVGLEGITQFSDTLEQTLAALESGTLIFSPAVNTACQQALATIPHYLDELLNGKPDQSLRLYPVYRELIALRGITEAPPADLFFPDLSLRPPRREKEPAPLDAETLIARLKAARLGFQRGLLKWLKADAKGLKEMRNSVSVVEFTQRQPAARAFWWISQGFLDSLILEGIPVDAQVKRLCARIDGQIGKLVEGTDDIAERLYREALYYIATASQSSDHIECVRAAYQLNALIPKQEAEVIDIAPHMPHLRAMRETLETSKNAWERYAANAGDANALRAFVTNSAQLIDNSQTLGQLDIARLTVVIHSVATLLQNAAATEKPAQYNEELALEVATALLLTEIALDEFGRLGVDFAHQVDIMTSRLNTLVRGDVLSTRQALELPRLIELAQRAQKRLLISQVSREILNNLVTIEQTLDGFFRNPTRRNDLAALRLHFKQVEGALNMLGEQRAITVLQTCAQQINAFMNEEAVADEAAFAQLAHQLSALHFFVEQLQHGAANLDAILNPGQTEASTHDTTGNVEIRPLTSTVTTEDIDIIEAEDAKEEASSTETELDNAAEAEQIAAQLAEDTSPNTDERVAPALQAPSAEAQRLLEANNATVDAELLAIFLEEATEVLDTIAESLPRSVRDTHDQEALATIRRAFHTLKGSGRMVNLNALGDIAWLLEQTMNHWISLDHAATPLLHNTLEQALGLFNDWIEQLASSGAAEPAPAWQNRISTIEKQCAQLMHGETIVEAVTPSSSTDTAPSPAVEQSNTPQSHTATISTTPASNEQIVIGDIHLSPSLYNVYLSEARSHLDCLKTTQAQLQHQAPSYEMLRAAHTLGGISGTLGIHVVKDLARTLEQALERFTSLQTPPDTTQQALFVSAIEQLNEMLSAFSTHQAPVADTRLLEALEAIRPSATSQQASVTTPADPAASTRTEPSTPQISQPELRQTLRLQDDLDAQLLPLFLEEGQDLLRDIGAELHHWHETPQEIDSPQKLQRLLHTLKGSARMAGAMRMGELVHGMETQIDEHLQTKQAISPELIDHIDHAFDRAQTLLSELELVAAAHDAPANTDSITNSSVTASAASNASAATETPDTPTGLEAILAATNETTGPRAMLRVHAEVVDELVNEAGEMAIARSRIEGEMRSLKTSLHELTENVLRLRQQLREIEIQAESQMQSQMAHMQESKADFDPLEMDRFSRFQELTRMMAESVNDVTTVQHNLKRNLDHADAALIAQARLNRELSQALMNVRMVPFDSISDRLYRIVRKTAKELGKRVNLNLQGAQLELDRSVLEKMTGPLEHLLRNAIVHGIETPEIRQSAGKALNGEITISLRQEGNDVILDLSDDGAGLDFAKIRSKGLELGLLQAHQEVDERRLTQLIFAPGFSTASQLSEVAGRGVGMDVVKTETALLGGRIDVSAQTGQGTRFRIYLPLTLAVAQVLLVQAGGRNYGIPSTMVEQVQELRPAIIEKIRQEGSTEWHGANYPWHYLPRLLGDSNSQPQTTRKHWLLFLKGGDQHLALEVDHLSGNQEIVLKKIGPQLARVPGLAGATVLGTGEIALVLNPVALLNHELQLAQEAAGTSALTAAVTPPEATNTPLIMVVDDSLTVRKITSRLLTREGIQVITAKDGVDALEQLLDFKPAVMLVDIEMPRMDGFDLTRNVRLDPRLKNVPIIMITSRIADKHRNYAQEIGVNEYLGKPYDEESLLKLIRGYLPKPEQPSA